MENGAILDAQITASSVHSPPLAPLRARLNSQVYAGSWSALVIDVNQWLQVDFLQNVTLSKVATQGRYDGNHWVMSYSLSHSVDGSHWAWYRLSDGKIKVLL